MNDDESTENVPSAPEGRSVHHDGEAHDTDARREDLLDERASARPAPPSRAWNENLELFEAELRRGHRFAELVGERLRESGYPVTVTPLRLRDRTDQIPQYANELDIVVGEQGGPSFVVECKSRRLRFTEDSESFPYSTAMVDTKSGWDAKQSPPQAVVLVSQKTGSMLVVSVKATRRLWEVQPGTDGVRGIPDKWYTVPRSHLKPMSSLIDYLRSGHWTQPSAPPMSPEPRR